MTTDIREEAENAGMDAFIHFVVADVVAQEPYARILDRAGEFGPVLLPALAQQAPDGDAGPGFRMLAREIVERTPRPDLRFATRKIPLPGRNDPCLCGSGRKYKHCCARLERLNPGLGEITLLPYVLDCLPRKRWPELVGSAIDPDEVAHVARDMLGEGDAAAARALLEPWFRGEQAIAARHEYLFDTLLDAYTIEQQPRKKQRLLQAALARGDRVIRSAAQQRLATMSADAGDYEQAWRHFHDAQREHADAASLSHLEVMLLLSQGRAEQARERARFWIARLRRQDAEGYRELIGFLRQVCEQGESALFEVGVREWPELAELRELLAQAPEPAVQHRLRADGESAGPIRPLPKLAKALARWGAVFPGRKPSLTAMQLPDHPAWDDPEPWLDCLRAQPLLWQSFEVLDDLVLALDVLPAPGVRETLIEPILARAERLLELLLQAEDAHDKPLEWGWHQNRPALRLLAQRVVADLDQPDDATVARIERLLALNPNDNHGFRNDLMAAYLRRGQFEQAQRLAQRFDEDVELKFARALALWAQDRSDEALRCVQQAHALLPRVLPTFLAEKPRKPKLTPGMVSWGGADQAWLLRERLLPAWQAVPGALAWLRTASKALH